MLASTLKVYLFNVGSGDHLMVEFPDSSIGIIDSFFSSDRLNLQEPPAVTYLKYRISKNKNKNEKIHIAFLCLSHADLDHIKNVRLLFDLINDETNNIELENLWLFAGLDLNLYKGDIDSLNAEITKSLKADAYDEFEKTSDRYSTELEAIETFKLGWRKKTSNTEFYFNDFKEFDKYNEARPYRAFSVGPIAKLINDQDSSNVQNLISDLYERVQSFQNLMITDAQATINLRFNRNVTSAILGINSFDNKLLFFGDATSGTIKVSLEDIPRRNSNAVRLLFNPNFVKVSHHGSRGSTTREIWSQLFTSANGNAMFGISAGHHKRNKHPHAEFFDHISECCKEKNINSCIYRTNECIECDLRSRIIEEVDLDYWFKLHGCEIDDIRLQEAFDNEVPPFDIYDAKNDAAKNLLAYIFEFPCNGQPNEPKIYKGVSSRIGKYSECVFEERNDYYCY